MREYQKPNAEYVAFMTEAVTTIIEGNMGTASLDDTNPLD